VTNPENAVAFMTHLRLIDAKGNDIVPVFWEDNYFTLLPKESREVWASYDANSLGEQVPSVLCDGWNVSGAVKLKPKTAAGQRQRSLTNEFVQSRKQSHDEVKEKIFAAKDDSRSGSGDYTSLRFHVIRAGSKAGRGEEIHPGARAKERSGCGHRVSHAGRQRRVVFTGG